MVESLFSLAPYVLNAFAHRAEIERGVRLLLPGIRAYHAARALPAPDNFAGTARAFDRFFALVHPNWVEIETLYAELDAKVFNGKPAPWNVARYQLFLRQQGLYLGEIDGKRQPHGATEHAVRAFQATQGLDVDGDVGVATTERMMMMGA